MSIESRVAVITGASSGIGAALARQLAARGVRVGLLALPDAALEAEAEAIRARGGIAASAAADVTDRLATHAAVEQLAADLGPIDLMVLNAGIGLPTPAAAFSAAAMECLVRVNLLGAANAIEAVLPAMIERRRGHLVGMSSLTSLRGMPVASGYVATKAGLATLLEGLRVDLRAYGIAVTIVRPGFVRTPMTAGMAGSRLMMEVEPAARIIIRGIAARRREVSFPRSAAWIMGVVRHLPGAVYDRLVAGRVAGRIPQDLIERQLRPFQLQG
jgi:short-subunit dehydrogenase